jgi:flagellar hook protein FlgE
MGLTSALYTGLSGMNASQFALDVIGDNIANLNTIAFKGSRTLFQSQFARTLSAGTKPSGTQGGTNPMQVGLGSTIGSIQRSASPGSLETTGVPSDLAVEGNGFFVVRTPENERVFTRDGAFTLSADNRLISADGFFVQGYGVNKDFQLIPGALTDVRIPVGTLTTAKATSAIQLDGTLDSSGDVATQGTILRSQVLNDPTGAAITSSTALTALRNPSDLLTPLLANGNAITINGIKRGGREVPSASFTVGTTGTTVGDFLSWLDDTIGIDTAAGVAGNPGTAVTADGRLEIRGNAGIQNALSIDLGTLSSNGATTVPFAFDTTQQANGESTHTSFVVYDSIGTPVSVDLTMVLEQRTTGGSVWRFYADSPDNSGGQLDIGTGTVEFDSNGQFVESSQNGFVVNRVDQGADNPLAVSIDFNRLSGLNAIQSSLVMSYQDGFATGTMIDYSIGQDGVITGTFTNGLNEVVGQVALATFSNPAGLIARSNNVYFVGPNSGEARITAPLTMGAGKISSGALELSNVDLSKEFINLITSSTAFSASSRVISTSDQLLQELLMVARQ